jgi:hypothetical protein
VLSCVYWSAEDAAAGKKQAHIYPSFAPSCSLLISRSVCSSSRSRVHTHSHSISRVFCWQTANPTHYICAPPLCCFRCSVFVAYLSQSGDAAIWQIKPTAINRRRRRVYALIYTRGDLFCLQQSAQMWIYPMIATMPDPFHMPSQWNFQPRVMYLKHETRALICVQYIAHFCPNNLNSDFNRAIEE